MSLGSRIVIAAVSFVCALMFFLTALDPSGLPSGALVFYGMAAVCVIIAVACLFPKSHPVTLRLIGGLILSAYVIYVFDSFQTQNFTRAVVGFLVWGLPSGYLAVTGKYPSWGKGAAGFNGAEKNTPRKRQSISS
ncbi:MAG: hypothetical protein AAF329_29270 [Cyanobacteria bacterium P01_A01_bin.17]